MPPPTKQRRSKYSHICNSMREEILSGSYNDGDRLPSEAELVVRFGASRPTVARALHDLQTEGLIDRRAGSGTFIRMQAKREADMFGLIIPGLGHTEIFEPICAAMARAAHDRRYTFLWGDSTHDAADPVNRRAEELCQQYVDRRVSGVFFAPLEFSADQYAINRRIADALKRANIPVVLLDRDLEEFPRRSEFDVVGIDNFAGGYAVAEHLINLGCRRIRFVARPQSAATVDSRIAGCREVLVKNQLDHGAKWIRYGDPADADFVRRLMNGDDGARPDAFVCANDETAALLMRGLREQGFKVPSDVRIVGFDDVKYATLLPVTLTTIHQPCQDIGEAAVRVMIDRLENPNSPAREIIIHAPLVVRASCGAKAHVAVG